VEFDDEPNAVGGDFRGAGADAITAVDRDIREPNGPVAKSWPESPVFEFETLIAYELGYRAAAWAETFRLHLHLL